MSLVPPEVLPHTPDQRAKLEVTMAQTQLTCTEAVDSLAAFLLELREGKHHRFRKQTRVLQRGQRLKPSDTELFQRESDTFRAAMATIHEELTTLTDTEPPSADDGLVVKHYGGSQPSGVTPHRDHKTSKTATPKLVSVVTLWGKRTMGFGVAPVDLLDLPNQDRPDTTVTRKTCLKRYIMSDTVAVRPMITAEQTEPGQVLCIDERSEWDDPVLGRIAAWHSVFADFPDDPQSPKDNCVLSLVIRNARPTAHLPNDA